MAKSSPARTGEHRESNGEKKRLKERLDWLEDRDVIDEDRVPQETNDENVDQKHEKEDDEPLDKVRGALDVGEIRNHL